MPFFSNQHFKPCSTYKGKFKWHTLQPQTLYSKNVFLLNTLNPVFLTSVMVGFTFFFLQLLFVYFVSHLPIRLQFL